MSDSTGPTGPITMYDLTTATGPIEPSPITIDDLLTSYELLVKKESEDKVLLDSIGNMSHDELKNKLVSWASLGFPNAHEVHRISINLPSKCSDGVVRDLTSYIEFCSGKTIHQHVASVQQKLSGITVSFANMGGYTAIVVSRD